MIKNLTIQKDMVCMTSSEFDRLYKAVQEAEKIKSRLYSITEAAENADYHSGLSDDDGIVMRQLQELLEELAY